MASEPAPGLRLERLTKWFSRDVLAVSELSLDIPEGSFVTLLGPSGCGKTTTLRMIAGFERPSSGEIYYGSESWTRMPPHRRPVNTVFQDYALFPHMRVFENVAYGLRAKGLRGEEVRRRVYDWLDRVGLAHAAHRRPHELSGGQRQRVALARALVMAPKVLLLDEPLGALDLQLRRSMQLVLMELRRETGTTFLYVTHDQEEAMTMSDRIAVLRDGRLEQVGTPDDLYYRPATKFVASFVGETNLLEGRPVDRSGDALRIDLGSFQMWARLVGVAAGLPGRVTVAVRPENLVVGAPGQELPNRCQGTVEERALVAGQLRLYLRIDDRLRLQARIPASDGAVQFARGDRVAVGWSIEATRAYAE